MATSVDLTGSFTTDMHRVLREAAQHGALAADEVTGATVVLRHDDVESLAHDPRLNGIGLTLFDVMGITDGPLRDWYGRLMFTTEGDYHRRIRSLVSKSFTPRSVAALQSTATAMAEEAAGTVRDGGDLVTACSQLGTRLICRLLGVPDADVAVFARWADALSPVFFVMTAEQVAAATTAIIELHSYVDELTARRAQDPGPDLITALLAAEADGERLTHDETVTMIANLLVAGHDTTGSQIPCSLLVALQYRDEIARDDDVLMASAVTETIRMEPSIPLIPRTAVAPIEMYGVSLPAGSMVFLCIAAACRDETAWHDPDQFDAARFTRPDTPKLVNFGAGVHYCLGTALAKVTVHECVRSVLAVDPPLRLTENPEEIPWRQVLGRSPARLLVA
ncbi:cytochrome P450 [Mycolicibacterium arseniciresistens]|uniref:Cytochrome P450 n=1 Tax=Mycolicibacterium arseniciresistens TaxID=3062257 RepID=A0ABT8UP89_9MYCO|nr:cytochrome P450 [Mycolicibacterium arseniciresistens]MDO3637994.1 cytochrome P450 [Mycolicibacterium arseniciresistens]